MVEILLQSDPSKLTPSLQNEFRNSNQESVHMRLTIRSHIWRPPTDVYETEDAILVRVEIAGMNESDFSIILDGQYLLIRGMRAEPPERRAYHQMEIPFGEFATEVELPHPVLAKDAEAFYSNGFLRIILPKARPQKIFITD